MFGDFEIEFLAGALSFMHTDLDETIREEFHQDADELAQLLLYRLRERTPVWTGATQEDEQVEVNPNPHEDTLLTLGIGEQNQIDAWGRVYWRYVEGGEYGLPTWTNPPRLMFAKTETEDLPLISAWAVATLDQAVYKIATGQGFQL